MIIDFHTHTFPDKIAEKSISHLETIGNVKAKILGTYDALKQSMLDAGIDCSVVLPVATNAHQVKTINNLSYGLNGKNNIYFAGAIHPNLEDIDGTLDEIKQNGLFGIKIHPDYQGMLFDSDSCVEIISKATSRGLYVITHAGFDFAFPDKIHCLPDMVLNVLNKLNGVADNKIILAHMGACNYPDEVLLKLAGKPVFFDTSLVLTRYKEKCFEIIKKHTADKILFATDSPWACQKEFVDALNSLDLSKGEKDKIFYKNAVKILNLNA